MASFTSAALAACLHLPGWACTHHDKSTVSPQLLYSVCMAESGGNPRAYHPHDGQGASIGICQIKLKTARWLGFWGEEQDLFEPHINAVYAAAYLTYTIKHYGSRVRGISAYNAGHPTEANLEYVDRILRGAK